MQTATIVEKPRKQAISGRFWGGRTYRGHIKDDHKWVCRERKRGFTEDTEHGVSLGLMKGNRDVLIPERGN